MSYVGRGHVLGMAGVATWTGGELWGLQSRTSSWSQENWTGWWGGALPLKGQGTEGEDRLLGKEVSKYGAW